METSFIVLFDRKDDGARKRMLLTAIIMYVRSCKGMDEELSVFGSFLLRRKMAEREV